MRRQTILVLATLMVASPLAARAEEIRMIGQSVMYSSKSILSNIIDSRTHRTLIKAMKLVKLEQPLMRRGTFTVFAPDDVAFATLPQAHTPQSLLHVNRTEIARLLHAADHFASAGLAPGCAAAAFFCASRSSTHDSPSEREDNLSPSRPCSQLAKPMANHLNSSLPGREAWVSRTR